MGLRWLLTHKRTLAAQAEELRRQLTAKQVEAERWREAAKAKAITDRNVEAVIAAAADWLVARVAVVSPKMHATPADRRANEDAFRGAVDLLDKACRAAFMVPGMRGSWGRGVERSWPCGFDPQGLDGLHGCECAGGGYTEESCRHCPYRDRLKYAEQKPWKEGV